MPESRGPKRYVLVPQADSAAPGRPVRRFRLARLSVSPVSALGVDRHERLEEVAQRDRRGDGR